MDNHSDQHVAIAPSKANEFSFLLRHHNQVPNIFETLLDRDKPEVA